MERSLDAVVFTAALSLAVWRLVLEPVWAHVGPTELLLGAALTLTALGDVLSIRLPDGGALPPGHARPAVTGLADRATLEEALEAGVPWTGGGALLDLDLDLDRFEPVNDQHGHRAGDELAVRLQQDPGRAQQMAADIVHDVSAAADLTSSGAWSGAPSGRRADPAPTPDGSTP